jgi:hypothetical protein
MPAPTCNVVAALGLVKRVPHGATCVGRARRRRLAGGASRSSSSRRRPRPGWLPRPQRGLPRPFLLDHAFSGRTPERSGNRLAWLAPQGVYSWRGEHAWVAVTVGDDQQWSALASVVGSELDEPSFSTLAGRLAHHDELDALISAWTASRTRRRWRPDSKTSGSRLRGAGQHRRAPRPAGA